MANEIDIRVNSNPSRQGIRRIEQALTSLGQTATQVGQQSDRAFTRMYEQIRLTAESASDLRARIDSLGAISTILQRLGQNAGTPSTLISSLNSLNKAMAGLEKLNGTKIAAIMGSLQALPDPGDTTGLQQAGQNLTALAKGLSSLERVNARATNNFVNAMNKITAAVPSPDKIAALAALGAATKTFGTLKAPQKSTLTNFQTFINVIAQINPGHTRNLVALGRAMTAFSATPFKFDKGAATDLMRFLNVLKTFKLDPRSEASVKALAAALNGLARQSQAAVAQMQAAGGAARRAGGEFRWFGGQVGTLSSFFGRTEAAFQGFVAVLGTNAILREIGTLQKFSSGLTAIGGSSSFAAVEMRKAIEVADKYGIALSAVSQGYSQLLASAQGSNLISLQESRELFEDVSQAVRVFGLSTEDAEGVYRALTQIVSKGSLQMEELRGQLGDRLPGAVSIFARGMGVTTAQLVDMTKQAEVTGETLRKGLIGFGNELEKITDAGVGTATQSVIAELGRLSTAFTLFAGQIGSSGFSEGIINLSKALRDLMAAEGTAIVLKGIGTAFSLITANIYPLIAAIVLFGFRSQLSFTSLTNSMALARTGIGVFMINVNQLGIAVLRNITVPFTAAAAAVRAFSFSGMVAGIGGAVGALRGLGAMFGTVMAAMGRFTVGLLAMAVMNPLTTLATALLILPPIFEAIARANDKARMATDALSKASELQSQLMVDTSEGVDKATASYEKLAKAQQTIERIKLNDIIAELAKAKKAQDDFLNNIANESQYDSIRVARSSMAEESAAFRAVFAAQAEDLRKGFNPDTLSAFQSALEETRMQYGTLKDSAGSTYTDLNQWIERSTELGYKALDALRQYEAQGRNISELPPFIVEMAKAFDQTAQSTGDVITQVEELRSVLGRPFSIDEISGQIDRLKAAMGNKDFAGAKSILQEEDVRRLAGSDDFQEANAARLAERFATAYKEELRKKFGGGASGIYLMEGFGFKFMSPQQEQDLRDNVALQLAAEQLGLVEVREQLEKELDLILNPTTAAGNPRSRSPLETQIDAAKNLLENLNPVYAAQQERLGIENAINLLLQHDAELIAAMGGEAKLLEFARKGEAEALKQIADEEARRRQEARRTEVYGDDTAQSVQQLMDSVSEFSDREQLVRKFEKAFNDLYVLIGNSPQYDSALAALVALKEGALKAFDGDALATEMEKIDKALDKYDRRLASTGDEGRRTAIQNDIDAIMKLVNSGKLTAEAFGRATRAIQLMKIELAKLTPIGATAEVMIGGLEEGLMGLTDPIEGSKFKLRDWANELIRQMYRTLIIKPIVDWLSSMFWNFMLPGSGAVMGGGPGGGGFASGITGAVKGALGTSHTGGLESETLGRRPAVLDMKSPKIAEMMLRSNERLVQLMAGSEVIKYGDRRHSEFRPKIILKNEEVLGPDHPLNIRNLSKTGYGKAIPKMHTGGVEPGGYAWSYGKPRAQTPAQPAQVPERHKAQPMQVSITNNVTIEDKGTVAPNGQRGFSPDALKQLTTHLSDANRAAIVDTMTRRQGNRSMKVT